MIAYKRYILPVVVLNVVIITAIVFTFIIPRKEQARMLDDTIALQQRRLSILEKNLDKMDENQARLELLKSESATPVLPAFQSGNALAELRDLLFEHKLNEEEFYAGEYASHTISGVRVAEIKGYVLCTGSYDDIINYLCALAEYDIYYRIERVQISGAEDIFNGTASLRLDFAIYGR